MEKISFWDLIASEEIKKISIPTIQRDYALGRRDKVFNRQSFLAALHNAITTDEDLPLDFVYGVDNDTMFVPLDGQQRLTTLWLLHWYVAYKGEILDDPKVKTPLLKFSYETRISSSDFCKSLCNLSPNVVGLPLRDWITQQTWFFHQYKQDPTIMGMLNMIAGTDIKDDKDNDIIDGLEEIFKGDKNKFLSHWKKLTTTKCIKFNKLHVNLGDSDELYVKMNARGKQLTDFENFKTELVQHVKENEILGETAALDFAAKLDVQWTDIFWENRWEDDATKDISIDEIYFAFIRRFVRLECIRKQGEKSSLAPQISQNFTSFKPYKTILDKKSVEDFVKIMNRLRGPLDAKAPVLNTVSPWGESFEFVPKYIDKRKDNISSARNTQLLLFYGYCRYLLMGEYDNASFAEWNRILWNICENRVDKSNPVPTMSEIDLLAPYSHNILSYLSQGKDIECQYNKEQLLEEQSKARHLQKYSAIIKEMEGYAFFKGAIRFLFYSADKTEDWDSFELKSKNIKELIPIDSDKRQTIKLLTPYLSNEALCDIYYRYWATNSNENLHNILLYKNALPYLHNFLLKNDNREQEPLPRLHQDIIDLCEKAFGGGYLRPNWSESKYIWTNYSTRSGYYGWCSFVIGNEAHWHVSNILNKSDFFEIHKDLVKNKIGNHIPSLYIHFKYGNHWLSLYGNNTICLMTENWENKLYNPNDNKGYYISINGIETEDQLRDRLDGLIKAAFTPN